MGNQVERDWIFRGTSDTSGALWLSDEYAYRYFVDFAISLYNFIWTDDGESQNSLDKKHVIAEEK